MKQKLFALSFGFVALLYATQHVVAQEMFVEGMPAQGMPAQGMPAMGMPAMAQCGARDEVVAQLAAGYGETRRSMGLAANSAVIEVYASEATGTWTITVTLPSGMTCLVASGEGFETMADKLPAKGEDA
jgi:hypothetical protein